jgi:hypothetical protein
MTHRSEIRTRITAVVALMALPFRVLARKRSGISGEPDGFAVALLPFPSLDEPR